MRFANWHHALIMLLLTVVLAGCAPRLIPRIDEATRLSPQKICGKSPEQTAKEFIENLSLGFFWLLNKLVAKDQTRFSIFGGLEVVLQLTNRPDIQQGKTGGSEDSDILEIHSTDPESDGVLRVVLERIITVTSPKESLAKGRETSYHRTFRMFHEKDTNCITRIISIDTEWKRVQ